MQITKTTKKAALLVGVVLVAASLLADVIGIGNDVGFGSTQTAGTIVGVLVIVAALVLKVKDGATEAQE